MANEKKLIEIRIDMEDGLKRLSELTANFIELEKVKKSLKKTDADYAIELAKVNLAIAENKKQTRELTNEIVNEEKIRQQRLKTLEKQEAQEAKMRAKQEAAIQKESALLAKQMQDEEAAALKKISNDVKAETAYQKRMELQNKATEQIMLAAQKEAAAIEQAAIREEKAILAKQANETALIEKAIAKRQEATLARENEEARIMQLREKRETAEVKADLKSLGYLNQLQNEVRELEQAYMQLSQAEFENAKAGVAGTQGNQVLTNLKAQRAALADAKVAYGNHTMAVGNYGNATRGIAISMGQIANEIPNFAISARIGIMSLSNNIPMLTDAIRNLNLENKKLRDAGEPTKNVFNTLASSIFSWQTLIAVGVSLLVAYGDKLWQWAKRAGDVVAKSDAIGKSIKVINEAIASGGGVYADAVKKIQIVENAQRQFARGAITDKEFLHIYNTELGDTFGKTNDVGIALGNIANKKDSYKNAMKEMAFANALFAESAKNTTERIKIMTTSNSDILGDKADDFKTRINGWAEEAKKGYAAAKQGLKEATFDYNYEAQKERNKRLAEIDRVDKIQLDMAKKYNDKAFDIAKQANIDLIKEDEKKPKSIKGKKDSYDEKVAREALTLLKSLSDESIVIMNNELKEFIAIQEEKRQSVETTDEQIIQLNRDRALKEKEIEQASADAKLISYQLTEDEYFAIIDASNEKYKAKIHQADRDIADLRRTNAVTNEQNRLAAMIGTFDLETQARKQALDIQMQEELRVAEQKGQDELLIRAKYAALKKEIDKDVEYSKYTAVSSATDAIAKLLGETTKAGKAAAVATATIDAYLAIQKALASAPPPFNYIAAAGVAITAFANVDKILSVKTPSTTSSSTSSAPENTTMRKYHSGGMAGDYASTPSQSDEITATLLKTERVLSPVQTTVFNSIINKMSDSGSITKGVGLATGNETAVLVAALSKAISMMPAPIVTVKDIDLASSRVSVIDNISTYSSKNN